MNTTITATFKAHVADMIQDVVNELRDATQSEIDYLRICMDVKLQLIASKAWQPIATAPIDGTIIRGKWEDDEDLRPSQIKYIDNRWLTQIELDESWYVCAPPSHWQPIN